MTCQKALVSLSVLAATACMTMFQWTMGSGPSSGIVLAAVPRAIPDSGASIHEGEVFEGLATYNALGETVVQRRTAASVEGEASAHRRVRSLPILGTVSAAPRQSDWQHNVAQGYGATDETSRSQAILKLIGSGASPDECRGLLTNASADPALEVRLAAISAMTHIDPAGFRHEIERGLEDPEELVQDAAVYALGRSHDWDTISARARQHLIARAEGARRKTDIAQLARTFSWVEDPLFLAVVARSKARLGYVDPMSTY